MRIFLGLLFITTLLGVALCQDDDQDNYRGSHRGPGYQNRGRYESRHGSGYGGPSYHRGGRYQHGSRYRQGSRYHDSYGCKSSSHYYFLL